MKLSSSRNGRIGRFFKLTCQLLVLARFKKYVSSLVHMLFNLALTHKQPKIFGVKFSLREIERIFSIKMRNFLLRKMPK